MMDASMISLKTDLTKQLGDPVIFAAPSHRSSNSHSDLGFLDEYLVEIEGTSYFFVTVVVFISFIGILNTVTTFKLDRFDWQSQKKPVVIQW